jgi:hypothetical protein
MSGHGNNLRQNTEVAQLLSRARQKIDQGVVSLRGAAEDLAAAEKQGATQREIAKAVARSVGWVNGLLKWRKRGYPDDTPFGLQSRQARQRRVQAIEQSRKAEEIAILDNQPPHVGAPISARIPKNALAKTELGPTETEANSTFPPHNFSSVTNENQNDATFDSRKRSLLLEALGQLGICHSTKRASAALALEDRRRDLGMTWEELIIPAKKDRAAKDLRNLSPPLGSSLDDAQEPDLKESLRIEVGS